MTKDSTVYRAGHVTPMTVREVTPLGIKTEWVDEFGEKQRAIFDPKELRTRKPTGAHRKEAMKRFILILAVLLGCNVGQAQTPTAYDQQQDARIKALEDRVFGTTTGGTTTGGTTGGSTTGGNPSDRRVIFSTDCESGPGTYRGYGDWEKYPGQTDLTRADWNAGSNSGGIVKVTAGSGLPSAHSGLHMLKCTIGSGINDGVKVIRQHDDRYNGKLLPDELWVSGYVYIPVKITPSWMLIMEIKEADPPRSGGSSYNQPVVTVEFGNSLNYLRSNIKGRTGGSSGLPQNQIVNSDNPVLFPIGKWVRIELHYKSSTNSDGIVEIFQDGVRIINSPGRNRRLPASELNVYVNRYGSNAAGTLYWDDVMIETPR